MPAILSSHRFRDRQFHPSEHFFVDVRLSLSFFLSRYVCIIIWLQCKALFKYLSSKLVPTKSISLIIGRWNINLFSGRSHHRICPLSFFFSLSLSLCSKSFLLSTFLLRHLSSFLHATHTHTHTHLYTSLWKKQNYHITYILFFICLLPFVFLLSFISFANIFVGGMHVPCSLFRTLISYVLTVLSFWARVFVCLFVSLFDFLSLLFVSFSFCVFLFSFPR